MKYMQHFRGVSVSFQLSWSFFLNNCKRRSLTTYVRFSSHIREICWTLEVINRVVRDGKQRVLTSFPLKQSCVPHGTFSFIVKHFLWGSRNPTSSPFPSHKNNNFKHDTHPSGACVAKHSADRCWPYTKTADRKCKGHSPLTFSHIERNY